MMKHLLIASILIHALTTLSAQPNFFNNKTFTQADSLRGMLRPERTCYDVTFYDLHLKIDTTDKTISGYNEIHFTTINDFKRLQIDLFANMTIDSIVFKGQTLPYERIANAVFINFPTTIVKNTKTKFKVHYHGKPPIAKRPPWDGGFTWSRDINQKWWVAVTCEGLGASVWWPNKDHLSDEPDSMSISFAIPNGYNCVSNGRLRSTQKEGDAYTRFNWFVSYPINNYDVTLSIGDYTHFSDTYKAADGDTLSLDYFVLPENVEKAKIQFQQVKTMLACYEKYFGKYPFWRDGYKLIETPHLGMEHQSAIAYGNHYLRGYLGGRIPDDMNWDFIIIHESGHEYFGNAISCKDHAEMWLHEGFTTYLEALYVEYTMSYLDAQRYLEYQKRFFSHDQPIIGPRNVNFDPTSDIYFKGSWILHTLRNAINDDKLWFDILHSFFQKYKYQTIDNADFTNYINQRTKKDYSPFFDEYLHYVNIPKLQYKTKQKGNDLQLEYKWQVEVTGFNMPIKVGNPTNYQLIHPTTNKWKTITLKNTKQDQFKVATELFLVATENNQ